MIRDTFRKIQEMIGSRSYAYKYTFRADEKWAQIVLKDLAKFCRAYSTTHHPDARIQSTLEGRREVWIRIQEHLQLTDQQIFDLHHIKQIQPKKGEENA